MKLSSADFYSLTLQEVIDCLLTHDASNACLLGMVDDVPYRVTVIIEGESSL